MAQEAVAVPATLKGLKKQVIKHSSAIQIASTDADITLIQRKCYNVLLAHAYSELPLKATHKMSISTLCRYLNFDSNNTAHLKHALRGLVKTNVEWNILGADRQQEWGVASLLSEVQIKNGFCFWEYPSSLRKLLYNPKIYARINLSLQNQITSKHSLILYENIFFYYRENDGCGETPWIEIPILKKLLGIKPEEYSAFKVFNNAVIKKSVEEINKKTDLQVTIEYKRNGRNVAAIKFFVILNNARDEEAQACPAPDKSDLRDRLVAEYGIKMEQAQKMVIEYDTSRIAENLVIVEQDRRNGKIKGNLAGYVITAVKQDFRKDRKPIPTNISLYEGMRVLYQGREYMLDASLSIQLENAVMPCGAISEKIRSGAIRVLELLLIPGIKLIIDGQIRTIQNSYGQPVINEDGIYLSEKDIKAGIKSRKYVIFEYPQVEIID